MVTILIKDARVVTLSPVGKLVIPKGYVYVKDGKVAGVGEGEPPEEFQYPELLINGEGRILIPGLSSGYTNVTLYPLRYFGSDISIFELGDYLKSLSRTDVYYLALMSFAELISKGVTSALIADIYLDNVARAANEAGFYVKLTPPLNCGLDAFDPLNELKLLLSRWHGRVEGVSAGALFCGEVPTDLLNSIPRRLDIYLLNASKSVEQGIEVTYINPSAEVREGKFIRFGNQVTNWEFGEGLGIGVRPSYSMLDIAKEILWKKGGNHLDVLVSITSHTAELIGYPRLGSIDVGSTANLVMLNASEPPGWPLPHDISHLVRAIIEGGLRVETVILGNEILVDNSELLTIGSSLLKKAVNRFSELLKEVTPRLPH